MTESDDSKLPFVRNFLSSSYLDSYLYKGKLFRYFYDIATTKRKHSFNLVTL